MFNHLKLNTISFIFSASFALLGLLGMINLVVIGSNVSIVSDAWKTYQIDRSAKTKLTAALQAEFGFGGVIHYFKNYVLRADQEYFDKAEAKLFETHASIDYFNTLDVTEKEAAALVHIKQTFDNYEKQLDIAKQAVAQGKTPEEIDKLVYVDDTLGIQGLKTLNTEQIKENEEQDKSKYRLLVRLRAKMGYNGFIHNFKNAVLRASIPKLDQAEKDLQQAINILTEYKSLVLTPTETSALAVIAQTFSEYSQAIPVVRKLILSGASVYAIDSHARGNDDPALDALITLDKEVFNSIFINYLVIRYNVSENPRF